MSLHVIVGAGAVGTGTAKYLVGQGHDVRIVTRSGSGTDIEGVTPIAADASDPAQLAKHAQGAETLYNCANPPYTKWDKLWPPLAASFLAAAEQTGAKLATMSNLYGYAPGKPMRETDPLDPPSKKGAIRAGMWEDTLAAHSAGRIRATEVRASDYFGPGLGQTAHLGDRVIPRVLKGKSVRILGNPDLPHSWSYIDDVCQTLATAGTNDDALGQVWHAPTAEPMTARDVIAAVAAEAGVPTPKVGSIPSWVLRIGGVLVPMVGELNEVRYQFEQPFVLDSSLTQETLGLSYTPFEQQVKATVASYQSS